MSTYGILVIMGVSGCGKSTIGKKLALELGLPFIEGDDFHPVENVAKMSAGIPLDDRDRQDWLSALNSHLKKGYEAGAVVSCSALKKSYRTMLGQDLNQKLTWIYLKGDYEVIYKRMQERSDHYMPPDLLQSQFDILEAPVDAIEISVSLPPDAMVKAICDKIKKGT